jgi:two-component sensor histidine kinase
LTQTGRTKVGVHEILKQELLAQGAVEGDNLQFHGPDIVLSSKYAQVMSMVFHELATNAVKHGALSVERGRVEVTCTVDRGERTERVRLEWRERGVVIEREPVKRGYGSYVLEKSVPDLRDGTLHRKFHPDGIECVIQFSIESDRTPHRGLPAGPDASRAH